MKLPILFSTNFFIFFFIISSLIAQDSTKTYKLKEITVSGKEFIEPKPVSVINKNIITNSDAISVSEIAKYIPSLKLQTNSRGESQFFLRGYGVRQLALFFDNVPLSIPWDNRIDLSLIPTESINSVTVYGGVPSVLFGANTLGGVISVKSFVPIKNKNESNFTIQLGSSSSQEYSGSYSRKINALSYLASFSYDKSDNYNLPNSIKDAYTGSNVRLNSDHKKFTGFVKLDYNLDENSKISLSTSYIDAEKGVPPETNVHKPRFWRYPLWQKLTFILNGNHNLSSKIGQLKYALSLTKFNMKIDQYADRFYRKIEDNEEDNDLTFYGRAVYSYFIGSSSMLSLAASGLNSTHGERFLSSGEIENIYAQNILSVGSEYEFHKEKYSILVGAGLDNQSTPKTGNKPKQESEITVNFKTKFDYYFADNISTQLVLGKKTRFPTLRELYSGALGRFIPNPNLKSEAAYNIESNWKYIVNKNKFNLSFFYSLLNNGIQRITLPGKQFKRINKNQIRTWGIEFSSKINFTKKINIDFNFSYLNSFAKNKESEFQDTLEYKPQIISGFLLNYIVANNLNLDMELNYIGKEFGLREGSKFYQKLPDYFLLNLRISYNYKISKNVNVETFFRVNNLLDKLYFTQWSLPEPGRQFLFGLKLNY